MGLLSHDNSDVALAVVDLLQELTDVDTVNETDHEAERLVEGLLGEQVSSASALALLMNTHKYMYSKQALGVHVQCIYM